MSAQILMGGGYLPELGNNFFQPTVLSNVSQTSLVRPLCLDPAADLINSEFEGDDGRDIWTRGSLDQILDRTRSTKDGE